jgi:uncharacterized protein (DUF58 family)
MGEGKVGAGKGITPRGKAFIALAALLYGLAVLAPLSIAKVLLALGSLLLVLLYASRLLLDLELRTAYSLRVDRIYARPLVEGRSTRVTLRFHNNSLLPLLFAEVVDPYPPLFRLVEASNAAVLSIPARGSASITYALRPVAGRHVVPPTRMVVRDPAGLFARKVEVGDKAVLDVQPRFEELRLKGMLIIPTLSPGGTLVAGRRGIGTQFLELREYVPGDEYRRIEWKASARTRRLMVKEYEQETSLEIMLVLDVSPSMAYGVAGSTKLEYSLRALATLSGYLLGRGDMVGLAMASPGGIPVLKPGRGKTQHRRIMSLLSSTPWPYPGSLSPSLAEALKRAANVMRRGRNIYIVFSDLEKPGEELGRIVDMLSFLKKLRNEVVVIAPYTPLFEAEGLSGIGEALYRIYAARSMEERSRVSKEFLKRGIVVVNVGPRDIVEAALIRVEAVRRMMR